MYQGCKSHYIDIYGTTNFESNTFRFFKNFLILTTPLKVQSSVLYGCDNCKCDNVNN